MSVGASALLLRDSAIDGDNADCAFAPSRAGAADAGGRSTRREEIFSVGSPMTAMRAPIFALPPSGTMIFRKTPVSYASSSMSALSDSISTKVSPCFIFSPSFRSHFKMTPSSIVSLSFGIITIVAIGSFRPQSIYRARFTARVILSILGKE